jgi:heme/copper-type cytochrome/quinol oxidase subunit 3
VLLGVVFLGYQVFEFTTFGNEGLNLGTNQFGASFFMLTGFHGTHVAVGVLYLGSLLLGSFRRNGLGPEAGLNVEIAGLYWHFVDIVWIVLFTVIYLIPA